MSYLITLLYGAAALLGAAFAAIELRMLARFVRNRAAIREANSTHGAIDGRDDDSAPTVTIQLPLYNERTSAERIVRAAAAQDYPAARFDIQVLDDSTDETTEIVAKVVAEVRNAGVTIQHIHRSHRTGYKAGALAEGLLESEAAFVAVFDADFAPEKRFLRRLILDSDAFDDPSVAFVQARWAWGEAEDAGWLSRVLALLLDRHFQIQKPVREFVGNVMTFNGSAGIWRREAIDDAGGWASDTLTEDLDLSYRCALAGWHGHYLHDVKVFNQLPGDMRAFKLQQRRWSKGHAQCFRKLMTRVMRAGAVVEDRWDEAFMLAGYAIHALLLASVLLWPWAVLQVDRALFWIIQGFMSLGIVAALLSFFITIHERDGEWRARSMGHVILGLAVGMGLMVNNTVGQIHGFLTTGGEFVRTPKPAASHADQTIDQVGAARSYASPLHWTFFAELLMMTYCFAGAAFLIVRGEPLWSLAMISWGICFGLVLQQQLGAPRA
jgi:cellulose synthase/poly-beta-1,6-N-acetylglucosamine synthase-like glycosyltransferase